MPAWAPRLCMHGVDKVTHVPCIGLWAHLRTETPPALDMPWAHAGWAGHSCTQRTRRPCSRYYRKWGFEPLVQGEFNYTAALNPEGTQGHIGGGMCAGFCDEDIGMCYCPSDTPYGRIPAPEQSLPGTSV